MYAWAESYKSRNPYKTGPKMLQLRVPVTLRITTPNLMTLKIMLTVIRLTVTYAECRNQALLPKCHYTEGRNFECHILSVCRYSECHYAECRYADCPGVEKYLRHILNPVICDVIICKKVLAISFLANFH
jgi:hypothetical protein